MTNQRTTTAMKIDSVGDLLAAIPALLGFYPDRSVVLLAHDEVTGRIGATARIDLGLTKAGDLRKDCRRHLGEAVRLLRIQGADRVFCVVVDDRPLVRATPALLQVLQQYARSRSLAEPDLEIEDVMLLPRVAAGERWVCRHGESGAVPDPETSPVMLAALVEGRTVHRSRSALTDLLAEEGAGIVADRCRDAAAFEADDDPGELLAALVATATGQRSAELTDADVALLGGALLDLQVRDAAMALALTVIADEARLLFAELARRLRGTPRAAAATLVAASGYLRGDGPLTGIALDAALAADPGYRAARLLATAFGAGLHPSEMSETAELGVAMARRLGVELPPRDAEFPLAG
ncbi:DUF4192 domain-containing protein [Tsukamurella spumae]|uniref:DUF4192 domain-containing protein n=1 Tax=Tsukamurella spumae TaxID=44753 RepID=A0A846WY29_9ACTN|nr:DUF4192 domain-containing protein [Tsukamurella spumae]NKY18088.1 DUF4192 domain-containing protein [Tsukamurella spumae]